MFVGNLQIDKIKKTKSFVIKNIYYLFAISAVISINVFQYFSTESKVDFLFTDDLWILAGSQYSTLYEKLICCSISHPIASLYFQELYSYASSDQNFLNILFLIGQFLPFSLFFLKHLPLNEFQKTMMIIFLISSPMYLNYSIRTKPYIYDAIIMILILNLYFKSIKTKNISLKDFFLLSMLTYFSFVSVVTIACCSLLIILDFIFKKEKIKISKLGILLLLFVSLSILFLNSVLRDETLNQWWNSYFIPVEGGLYLVFRWLYFSVASLFSESNPTNFGFSNFPTALSISLFLFSSFILFRNNKKLLNFVISVFGIALLMSFIKIYPFGGTRTNIYLYGAISITIAYGSSYLLKSMLTNERSILVGFVVVIIGLNLYTNTIGYERTTKSIDKEIANLVIKDIDAEDTKVLIHHGSHWFMSLYFPVTVNMENVILTPTDKRVRGSGGFSTPAPILLDDKFVQICFDFPQTKGVDCTQLIDVYFSENNIENFKFAGFYVEDRDFTDYIEAFKNNNFKVEEIYKAQNIIYLSIYK